ncbi:MAG: TetR/AcrR family transcriptional regulator [Pseudomonadota bacterium]
MPEFALNEVAEDLGLAVGSVYHFFPSKEALLIATAHRVENKISNALNQEDFTDFTCWQDVLRQASRRSVRTFNTSPAALRLFYGATGFAMVDRGGRRGSRRGSQAMARVLRRQFEIGFIEDLEGLIFRATLITDSFWRDSVRQHGWIESGDVELSMDAALAFCRLYIPTQLKSASRPEIVA